MSMQNIIDSTILARYAAIGKPIEVKITLLLDNVNIGYKIISGRTIRMLRWDIISRALMEIEEKYNEFNIHPIKVRFIDYRLEDNK